MLRRVLLAALLRGDQRRLGRIAVWHARRAMRKRARRIRQPLLLRRTLALLQLLELPRLIRVELPIVENRLLFGYLASLILSKFPEEIE